MLKSKNPGDILRQSIETLFATGDVSGLEQHPGMEALSKNFAKVKAAFPDIQLGWLCSDLKEGIN